MSENVWEDTLDAFGLDREAYDELDQSSQWYVWGWYYAWLGQGTIRLSDGSDVEAQKMGHADALEERNNG
jgi:hypothetical protein